MHRMFLTTSSCSGPSVTPNSSATSAPGNFSAFDLRKKSTLSRSRTNQPSGDFASQLSDRRSRIRSWKASPRSVGSR
jgi:hypothetical protein